MDGRRIEVYDGPPGAGHFVRTIPCDENGTPLLDDDLAAGERYVALIPGPSAGVLVPQEMPGVTRLRATRRG